MPIRLRTAFPHLHHPSKPLEIFKPLEAGAGKILVPIGLYKEVNDTDQIGVARERGIAREDPNQQVDDPRYGGQRKNDKQEDEREDTIGQVIMPLMVVTYCPRALGISR